MTAFAWCGLFLRWQSGALAALAATHTTLVAAIAWYVAEAKWGSASISASPTPLPAAAFVASWVGGTILLLGVGPWIGVGAVRGPWVGPNPTVWLPLGEIQRLVAAWLGSGSMLAVIALAPVPVYLTLFAMGAFTVPDLYAPLLAQSGVITAASLIGVWLGSLHQRRLQGPRG